MSIYLRQIANAGGLNGGGLEYFKHGKFAMVQYFE